MWKLTSRSLRFLQPFRLAFFFGLLGLTLEVLTAPTTTFTQNFAVFFGLRRRTLELRCAHYNLYETWSAALGFPGLRWNYAAVASRLSFSGFLVLFWWLENCSALCHFMSCTTWQLCCSSCKHTYKTCTTPLIKNFNFQAAVSKKSNQISVIHASAGRSRLLSTRSLIDAF